MSEYIKRETVLDALKQKSYPLQSDNGKGFVVIDDGIFCDDATDIINAIPADDVEPVVRGEWKESFTTRDCQCAPSGVSYTFWYTCSICGKKSRTKRERCLRCFSYMERSGSGE